MSAGSGTHVGLCWATSAVMYSSGSRKSGTKILSSYLVALSEAAAKMSGSWAPCRESKFSPFLLPVGPQTKRCSRGELWLPWHANP